MDPSSAVGYAERRINRAREVGALGVLAVGLPLFSGGLAWLGDHVRAYAFAGEAVELLEALDIAADPGAAYEAAAIESACRGMHDEARRLLDRARVNVAINGFDPMPPHLARVVALCALCRGDLTEVVEVLEDQLVRFNGVGDYLEPLGVAPLLVEAYLGLGRDDDARELTARFARSPAGPADPRRGRHGGPLRRTRGHRPRRRHDGVRAFPRVARGPAGQARGGPHPAAPRHAAAPRRSAGGRSGAARGRPARVRRDGPHVLGGARRPGAGRHRRASSLPRRDSGAAHLTGDEGCAAGGPGAEEP